MHHPQVVRSTIFNDCQKVNIDGYTEPQLAPNVLLKVPVRELHNILVSDPVDDRLKEARDADNNIIISDSTLPSLLPTQFKKFIKIKGCLWL